MADNFLSMITVLAFFCGFIVGYGFYLNPGYKNKRKSNKPKTIDDYSDELADTMLKKIDDFLEDPTKIKKLCQKLQKKYLKTASLIQILKTLKNT